jgi:hypothetical protein
VERSDLRGLSYGKEKAELLRVVRVLRQTAWSEGDLRAVVAKRGCDEFPHSPQRSRSPFVWLTVAETIGKTLEQLKETTELEPQTAQ